LTLVINQKPINAVFIKIYGLGKEGKVNTSLVNAFKWLENNTFVMRLGYRMVWLKNPVVDLYAERRPKTGHKV